MSFQSSTLAESSNIANLCKFCSRINLESLKEVNGYTHQPNYQSLIASSSECSLCAVIKESLDNSLKRMGWFDGARNNSGPVLLHASDPSILRERLEQKYSMGENIMAQLVAILGKYSRHKEALIKVGTRMDILITQGPIEEGASIPEVLTNTQFANCDENIKQLKHCLNICQRNHKTCSLESLNWFGKEYYRKFGNSGLPKRLVDVGMKDQSKVSLVDVGSRRLQYVALSYCWGHPSKARSYITTTTKTLAQMKRGVNISSLFQTIQDAIIVTRKLDCTYLWVDALCIIQPDDTTTVQSEWEDEIQKMALIYAQSYVTLSPSSVESLDKSFLSIPRSLFVIVPLYGSSESYAPDRKLLIKISLDFEQDFERDTYDNELAKRAWVKQERLLSRRIIHFTRRQIYWECRSMCWSELGGTRDSLALDSYRSASTFYNSLLLFQVIPNPGPYGDRPLEHVISPGMFLQMWSELIEEFSELKLTYPIDRLPSIAGLARFASLIHHARYLSGLWESNLTNDLFWTPKVHPMLITERKYAPSWSWACTTSPIRSGGVDMFKKLEDSISLQGVFNAPDNFEVLRLKGQIHKCEVSLHPQPPGPPSRCHTKLRPWQREEEPPYYSFWPIGTDEMFENDSTKSLCTFDRERGAQKVYFFLRLSCSGLRIQHCKGLLLNLEDQYQNTYSRIGVGWTSHSLWHDMSPSILNLA